MIHITNTGAQNKPITGGAYEIHIHRTYIINAGTYHTWENFEVGKIGELWALCQNLLANYFS